MKLNLGFSKGKNRTPANFIDPKKKIRKANNLTSEPKTGREIVARATHVR
jgi:hypothetical protein